MQAYILDGVFMVFWHLNLSANIGTYVTWHKLQIYLESAYDLQDVLIIYTHNDPLHKFLQQVDL